MDSLIHIYFEKINPFTPILHGPTFEKLIAEKYHLQNHRFGATVLVVLALGSRLSDDRRVFLENTDSGISCGWKFFSQVRGDVMRRNIDQPGSLYDLQLLAVRVTGVSTVFNCH